MPEMRLQWPASAEVDGGAITRVIVEAVAPHEGARAEVSLVEMPGDAPEPLPGFPFQVRFHPPRRFWAARITAPTEDALNAIHAGLAETPAARPALSTELSALGAANARQPRG